LYFPKITGRLLDEKLGNWHFWITFIGMNLTFFPMHFAGLYGMPRRIYRYEPGQGWETFNMMSSVGTAIIILGTAIFVWNFFKSFKSGEIAGNDPWGGGTLEWTIPSPPPEYNFARIPRVTSRYPTWDLNSGHGNVPADGAHIEIADGKSAKDLGIPMPNPTIKPMMVAAGMVIMFTGLLAYHTSTPKPALALTVILGGALFMVTSLYAWLLTPLEDAH
jgi:heme/copper-type cytochrome/quinol oxidase subunit 1